MGNQPQPNCGLSSRGCRQTFTDWGSCKVQEHRVYSHGKPSGQPPVGVSERINLFNWQLLIVIVTSRAKCFLGDLIKLRPVLRQIRLPTCRVPHFEMIAHASRSSCSNPANCGKDPAPVRGPPCRHQPLPSREEQAAKDARSASVAGVSSGLAESRSSSVGV